MEISSIQETATTRLFSPLLAKVSRSFYLSLRVLPAAIREPIALAYLLARIADTICDERAILPLQRKQILEQFKASLHGFDIDQSQITQLSEQISHEERKTLELLPQALDWLGRQEQKAVILKVLDTITEGMLFDLDFFPNETSGSVRALPEAEDLQRYTYLVAGCVGEFWTQICSQLPALQAVDQNKQIERGIKFGKALQLTNILRDVPADLNIGRCYLPQRDLHTMGIDAIQLLDLQDSKRLRPVLVEWMTQAAINYNSALDYILHIPKHCLRLRLACLWPAFIGLATLTKLATHPNPLKTKKVKVTRHWVYFMLFWSTIVASSNVVVKQIFRYYQSRLEKAL